MTEVTSGPAEAAQIASPYPGLKPFSEDESEFFFGRERDGEIIVANLRARRLTVLYGPSGVGKSSVLRAGVAASLRRRAAAAFAKRRRAPFVPVVVDNWKDDPVAGIVAAVERAVYDLVGDDRPGPSSTGDLTDDLLAWSEHFGGEVLLILDQFEELFEYHRTPGGTGSLDEELPEALAREAFPVSLLISIREDALALLDDRFKRSVPGLLDSRLRIGHLDRESAREAIVKPIEHYNEQHGTAIEIEPALVEEVLDQVARGRVLLEQTGAGAVDGGGEAARAAVETPYLQLVLSRLWQEEQRAGSPILRLETLKRLGGAETIVRTHLDEALESFPEAEQDVAADLFKYLVTPSGTKIALRPADLATYAEHPEETIQPVLRKLAERRIGILRPVAPPPGEQSGPRYEIYHDVLAGAILDWRSRHSQSELQRQKEAAQQEAREAQQREDAERRRGRVLRILLIGSLVLLASTVFALVFALQKRSAAIEQTERAQSILIADRAEAEPSSEIGVLMGVEGYRLSETAEARGAALSYLQANAGLPKLLDGHPRSVNDVAFSADSKVLASGGSDGVVRLWDVGEGGPIGAPLRPGLSIVNSVAIEGQLLAAAGQTEGETGGPVALWDIRDPQKPARLATLRAKVGVIAFGGGTAAPLLAGTASLRDSIELWDVRNARSPRRLPSILDIEELIDPRTLAFSPQGRILAAGGTSGSVVLWRIAPNGRAQKLATIDSLPHAHSGVESLAFSADGDFLVSAGEGFPDEASNTVLVWDVSTPARPRFVASPKGHVGPVYGVDFDPERSRLVSAGTDGQVLVWDTESWRPFGPTRAHDYAVDIIEVEVSPDGSTIASADNGGAIKVWSMEEPNALAETVGAPGKLVWDLAVTSNGVVAAASGLGGIDLWSASADGPPEPVARIEREENGTSYEVVSHDSLVIGSTGYTFGLWDVAGDEPRPLGRSDQAKHPQQWIAALAVTGDGETVASADFQGNIVLWDISDRENVEFLAAQDHGDRSVDALAFDPTGERLVSGDRGGTVRFWDVSDRTNPTPIGERFVAHQSDPVWALAFLPDELLVSGGGDRRVAFWDIEDPTQVRPSGRPLVHSNSVLGFSLDAERSVLAVADGDSAVVLYDIASRQALGFGMVGIASTRSTFEAAAFDEEGTTLYSAGQLNPVVGWSSDLWTGDRETLRSNACRLARRDLTETEWAEVFRETKLEDGYRRTCTE